MNNVKHKNSLKKQSKAVALKYLDDSDPTLLAKGRGAVARLIMEIAKDNDVLLKESEDALDELWDVQMGELIPSETMELVAEVLAFLCEVDREAQQVAHS